MNTAEGFFSLFKRGMKGIYQHCSEKHLHRYLAEFDFRYNNRVALGVDDQTRADNALAGVVGKRLMYRELIVGVMPQRSDPLAGGFYSVTEVARLLRMNNAHEVLVGFEATPVAPAR